MSIHPTAIVERGAEIGRDVSIGAFAYIGPNVRLGDGCRIHHHATIDGLTTMGEGCEVFPQAAIGLTPQDLKYSGEKTSLEIGKRNIFREMVTVHPGTGNGGGVTRIGNSNFFLIGVHVAHDCLIGNNCVIANYVQFAGHVHVEDNVNMGGHSAVHHFVTIGKHAFVGGMTRVAADVPPFMVVVAARGTRTEVRMVNGVGLQRSGYSQEDIAALKDAFMAIYARKARLSGVPISDRVQAILDVPDQNPHVVYLCKALMRSFAHGRHGRYLESLRQDPVHRRSWRLAEGSSAGNRLAIEVVGQGVVDRVRTDGENGGHETLRLTAQAEPGWAFAGWDGNLSGRLNPAMIVLDDHKKVTATFTRVSV
ncbi:MAG: acyl-ACP--UDP-N-acetylglucosamine O-acyltransferase [Phycisphaerae bacterium]|nr:acyl-ACP--UDP-N-acetylglucosamine O-acyltransferase [Phycisphaerae bacterium]